MTYQYLNTIDSHSCIFFFNTLKNLVKILLCRKCKLSVFVYLILFYFIITS